MFISIILIALGFVLLIKGADLLVDGASNIAKKFHIPEIIIGLTVISIGTTMPELFVSITSALDGYPDMAVGNAIGSCIANLLLILGTSSVIQSIKFEKETKILDIPICLSVSLIFLLICNINQDVSRIDGAILTLLFVSFILYLVIRGIKAQKNSKEENEELEDDKNKSEKNVKNGKIFIIKNIFFIIAGVVLLKFGGDLTVDNAVIVAKSLGLSDKIIGLTILAVGTSLPEFVTCVSAAIKGKTDIAIGNILGANILNLLLITGVAGLIKPIVYNVSYNIDMMFLIIGTTLLTIFPFIPPKNEMSRMNGIVYVLMYLGYMVSLFFI